MSIIVLLLLALLVYAALEYVTFESLMTLALFVGISGLAFKLFIMG